MRALLLVTTHLSLASAYLKPNTCESEKYKHANRSVAVCVTGLYRTAKHVMPHLRRQYPPDKFATFVVTDGIDKMRHYRSKRVCKYLAPTLMHDLPARQSSQHAGLVLCQRLVEAHEHKIKRRYDWVVRQRIDTLGCTPSPAIAAPVRHKIILVSYARCGWAADNWAWMSRDVLEVYVKGIVEQEAGLGHELLKHAISVWTPAFAPCFRIIREEGKYKRLRNADKFQARVSKIRKALAETSTRPVTFHEEVCLGGDE